MIAYLVGQPRFDAEGLILLVGGVGYGVRVTRQTQALCQGMTQVELYIYTHVREDALELFGFFTPADRHLFLHVLSVSGVGPKTALHILELGASEVVRAVQEADVSVFASVQRVGKKLAQKIIIELKSKLGSLKELELGYGSVQYQEVVSALQQLGFADSAIADVLGSITVDEMTLSEAITAAVKALGKGRA